MPTPEIQGDIMLLNGEETDVAAPVETASYISVDVTVVKQTATLTELSKQQQTLITRTIKTIL